MENKCIKILLTINVYLTFLPVFLYEQGKFSSKSISSSSMLNRNAI